MKLLSKRGAPAWIMLALGLVLSVTISRQVGRDADRQAIAEFAEVADGLSQRFEEKLAAHALILRGAAAFLVSSGRVTREQWHAFVDVVQADALAPGMHGVAFNPLINAGDLRQHIAEAHRDGIPGYTVFPPGQRPLYGPVRHIGPEHEGNRRALGYDTYADPVRRAAMEQARDTGRPTLSGKLHLIQEIAESVEPGVIMYVPVYRLGTPLETIAQRRAALIGWTSSPYRMSELVQSVLRTQGRFEDKALSISIHDGTEENAAQLLYSQRTPDRDWAESPTRLQRAVVVHGRHWRLRIERGDAAGGAALSPATITLARGAVISVLLFALMLSLLNTREHARSIAEKLTQELRIRGQQIEETEFRWKFALEGAGDGVWDWNMGTGTVYYSPRWKQMLGWEDTEIGTTPEECTERVHPEDVGARQQAIDDYLNGRAAQYVAEFRMRCKDGDYKWILARGIAVSCDATGRPNRLIGTHADITERKRAAMELAQHRDHLEDMVRGRTAELSATRDAAESANRAKSAFLANMSHELRTPMNGIMGMTSLALRLATNPRQLDQLHKSLAASRHLADVINDILDLSKIEADRLVLANADFVVADLIEESVGMHEAAAGDKGLQLDCVIDPALPRALRGDAMRLRQVLLNFLGNAIKFSAQGRIEVRASAVDHDAETMVLRLEVSDQGIGIGVEEQALLFRAFTQVDESSTRRFGGTGLGLVISRRIAELMGGSVGVVSQPGQGSRFWATFRLGTAANVAAVAAAPDEEPVLALRRDFAGRHVLVAEDDPLNREVATSLLESAGLVPLLAGTGAEAVALVARGDCDAVLMDVHMPGMNGLDATRAIRKLPGKATLPIIAMTASAFDEERALCLEAGMNDHIGKPVAPDAFHHCLLAWLRRGSSSTPGVGAGDTPTTATTATDVQV